MPEPILIARGLHKSYGDIHAVRGVDLEIARGEIFGLLGPNGAGKTTVIAMLVGLLDPDRGEMLLDGQPLTPGAHAPKARIGLVPQELALYPTISARDNLLFFGRIYGLRGKRLRQRVEAVLEMVGLTERAGDPIETYSGGMKRRINIAAGLLHEPNVLFLDEPTVGVDPQSRNAILEAVEALNRAGMTILYTTHYMEEAQRLCHRVAIMDLGRIIALDVPPDAAFAHVVVAAKLAGQTLWVDDVALVPSPESEVPTQGVVTLCSSSDDRCPGLWRRAYASTNAGAKSQRRLRPLHRR